MGLLTACIYVCKPVHEVPREAKTGHQIPRARITNAMPCGFWGLNLVPLEMSSVFSNYEALFQPDDYFLFIIMVCVYGMYGCMCHNIYREKFLLLHLRGPPDQT